MAQTKEERRKKQLEYYYAHKKDKFPQYRKNYHLKRKQWMQELKESLVCIRCGENRWPCIDFHHRDPNEKEYSISRMIRRCSKEKILAEIAKCDVLCSNCHRIEHTPGYNGDS